ncbi:MAG: hypothetical protein ABJC19_05970 [Gemmatimonadota bacterium]
MHRISRLLAYAVLSLLLVTPLAAQENFEVQVYGAELVPVGRTIFELHSNYTAKGSRLAEDGVVPTHHALHETLEITHGFTDWFELGFYAFAAVPQGGGLEYVGNHIRPRVSIPERYHWPVGLSLSQEIGYQRRAYSSDTWSWEIRPILDQQIGRFYWALNPTVEVSLKGENAGKGIEFAPNIQVNFDVSKRFNLALEYYGGLGKLNALRPASETDQQLIPAINIDFGPDWEFNLGTGIALTPNSDRLALKMIFGRRMGRAPAKHP